ncbi:hypothetical protein [Isoptericola sp. NPDC056605]|uniref:hypothetical protein n=1 Tax=Isoptericola sp. NPDC056605 TaxID=3345876 RepID=UPI0036A440E5
MDFLPAWVADLSPGAVLLVLVVMLLTGKGLATRREVEAEKSRADTWQAAWKAERVANQEKDEQQRELLENSRTTARIVTEIQAEARRAGHVPEHPAATEGSS